MGEQKEGMLGDNNPEQGGGETGKGSKSLTFIESKEDLLTQKEYFKQLLDAQSSFIVCFMPEGGISYANKAFSDTILPGVFEGKLTIFDCFTPVACGELREALKSLNEDVSLVSNSSVKIPRFIDRRSVSSVIEWELRYVEIAKGSARESQILMVGSDISAEEKNSQRMQALLDISAEQNQRLKSFTHIISHHVRSHTTNISGLLELLDSSEETEEEKEEYIRLLKYTAEQLEQTIRNLNQVISINESVSKTKSFRNLKTCVQRILELMEGKILSIKADVRLEIPEDVEVYVVPAYLNHILLNLVSNALKFISSHRQPEIRIYIDKVGDFVVMCVEDNGLGLDLERFKDRLFNLYETFHRTEESRGFGLFISKIQAEAMGGKIEVKSKPGEGSTFRVYMRTNSD